MFPLTKFRMKSRFWGRVAGLAGLMISLSAGLVLQAQDSANHSLIPDGLIAFVSGEGLNANIYVMKADGTQVTQLTTEGGTEPAWSPDGRQIAFTSMRDGTKEI